MSSIDVMVLELATANKLIKKLRAEKRQLRQLAKELNRYTIHDSCEADAGRGIDDDLCDCGLSDAQVAMRRLTR